MTAYNIYRKLPEKTEYIICPECGLMARWGYFRSFKDENTMALCPFCEREFEIVVTDPPLSVNVLSRLALQMMAMQPMFRLEQTSSTSKPGIGTANLITPRF